jgi:hypothetical protein
MTGMMGAAGGGAGYAAGAALEVASAAIGIRPSYRPQDFKRAGEAGARAFANALDPTRLGVATSAAVTEGLSQALSGKSMDLASLFKVGDDVFAPVSKSLETVASKVPFIGGELQRVYESVGSIGALSEKWLATMSQVGDKWQDISRVIAGQTFDTSAIDGLTRSVQNLFMSGAIVRESDIVRSIGEIHTRLGLAGKDLEEFAKNYSMANELLGTTLNLDEVTGVMNAFDVSAQNASQTLTQLVNIARDTGADMGVLLSTMKTLGPAFDQLVTAHRRWRRSSLRSASTTSPSTGCRSRSRG